jgi:regulator of sigma E protease
VTQITEERLDEMKNKIEAMEFGVRPRASFISPGSELLDGGGETELVTVHMGIADAASAALSEVPRNIRYISIALGKLVTRQLSAENLGGPIALFRMASISAEQGYQTFLAQMAIVSLNLGLINLLPIPILDGFAILAALWEGIRRRPIPDRAREVANMVGFAMLAMLVVLVFTNDITKMFR